MAAELIHANVGNNYHQGTLYLITLINAAKYEFDTTNPTTIS